MKQEAHIIAAKEHMRIAEEINVKVEKENDEAKKSGLRTVASQNYFYAGINAIEAMLARKEMHSFNHENRNRNMAENPLMFDEETYKLYNDIDREIRNKVSYRGQNGKDYETMNHFAEKMVSLL